MQSPAPQTAPEGECLDFGDYRALVKPGRVPSLIVSVAGIGNPFADKPGEVSMAFEWQGALRRSGAPDHVIFLQDRRRSWFNDPRGWPDLVAYLRAYVERHGIGRKLAFGLSMGATGAVLVDRDLHCDAVVAISPQCRVGVGGGHDPRFQFLWEKIERIVHGDLAQVLRPEARCHVLFSVDTPEDVDHARALRRANARPRLLAVHGSHNLGVEMNRFGRLEDFASAAVREDFAALSQLGFFEPSEDLFSLAGDGGQPRPDAVRAFGLVHPAQLPECCFAAFHAAMPSSPYPVHAAQIVPAASLARFAVEGWEAAAEGGLRASGPRQRARMRVMDPERRPRIELAYEGREAVTIDVEPPAGNVDVETKMPEGTRWTGLQLVPRIAR